MLRLLDLFSGIGGFSLGLEKTKGFKTVAFCEIDPFCRKVLKKHWPYVPVYEDVRILTGEQLRADGIAVDVVCGGPPCQPNSSAARGQCYGTADPRFLWYEAIRLVSEIHPIWFLFENVTNFDRVALTEVALSLESVGYQIWPPLEIPACAVGHDHWRPRLWLCGNTNRNSQSSGAVYAETSRLSEYQFEPRGYRAKNGLSNGLDRLRALGNAVVPQIPEIIGNAILAAERDSV